jgi:hypothetical protein
LSRPISYARPAVRAIRQQLKRIARKRCSIGNWDDEARLRRSTTSCGLVSFRSSAEEPKVQRKFRFSGGTSGFFAACGQKLPDLSQGQHRTRYKGVPIENELLIRLPNGTTLVTIVHGRSTGHWKQRRIRRDLESRVASFRTARSSADSDRHLAISGTHTRRLDRDSQRKDMCLRVTLSFPAVVQTARGLVRTDRSASGWCY